MPYLQKGLQADRCDSQTRVEEASYPGRNAEEAHEVVAPVTTILIDCNDGYLAVQIESWGLSYPGGMGSCLRHLLFSLFGAHWLFSYCAEALLM